jgi:hypothetical protein
MLHTDNIWAGLAHLAVTDRGGGGCFDFGNINLSNQHKRMGTLSKSRLQEEIIHGAGQPTIIAKPRGTWTSWLYLIIIQTSFLFTVRKNKYLHKN